MKARILLGYQLLTGLSDTSTGALLILTPAFTLHMMGLHVGAEALPFLAYIGVFVLSVGLACLYGAYLVAQSSATERLETIWLLTALTRALVAVFLVTKIAERNLEVGWITVAVTDGVFSVIQAIGLLKGWLQNA